LIRKIRPGLSLSANTVTHRPSKAPTLTDADLIFWLPHPGLPYLGLPHILASSSSSAFWTESMQLIMLKLIHHPQSASKWVIVFDQSIPTSIHPSSFNLSRRDAGWPVEISVVLSPDPAPIQRHVAKQFSNGLIIPTIIFTLGGINHFNSFSP
jgi:hypothetical protein